MSPRLTASMWPLSCMVTPSFGFIGITGFTGFAIGGTLLETFGSAVKRLGSRRLESMKFAMLTVVVAGRVVEGEY